jgi:hypothetical protein
MASGKIPSSCAAGCARATRKRVKNQVSIFLLIR